MEGEDQQAGNEMLHPGAWQHHGGHVLDQDLPYHAPAQKYTI